MPGGLADAAYDTDRLHTIIAAKRARAVIPSNPSRTRKHPLDTALYTERHLIEACFARLKQFRRVATRYGKTARNYLAVLTLAATMLWLKSVSTRTSATEGKQAGSPRALALPPMAKDVDVSG